MRSGERASLATALWAAPASRSKRRTALACPAFVATTSAVAPSERRASTSTPRPSSHRSAPSWREGFSPSPSSPAATKMSAVLPSCVRISHGGVRHPNSEASVVGDAASACACPRVSAHSSPCDSYCASTSRTSTCPRTAAMCAAFSPFQLARRMSAPWRSRTRTVSALPRSAAAKRGVVCTSSTGASTAAPDRNSASTAAECVPCAAR